MQHSTQQLSFLLGHHEHLGLGILGAGSPSLASPLPFCTMFFSNWFILFKVFVSQIIGKLTSSTPFLTKLQVAGLGSPMYVIPSQQSHIILMWYYFMDYIQQGDVHTCRVVLVYFIFRFTAYFLLMFTAYVTWM